MRADFGVLKSNTDFVGSFTTSSGTVTMSWGDFASQTSNNPSHTYTDFPPYLLNVKNIDNTTITDISISGSLTAFDVSRFKNLTTLDVGGNLLPTSEINKLLIKLDELGKTNGYLNVSGNRLENLSTDATTAYNNLVTKGWTVYGFWSPSNISTFAWYDASDTSTITVETGVSNWADKSGNGYDVTQGGGSNQPLTGVNTINGLNTLTFDGIDDHLDSAILPAPGDAINAISVVFSDPVQLDIPNTMHLGMNKYFRFRGGNNISGPVYWRGGLRTTADVDVDFTNIIADDTDRSGTQLWGIRLDVGTDIGLWYNGEVIGSTGATRIATTDTNITFSERPGATGSGYMNGYIAETIIVQDITVDTQQKIEGYLAHKWGIVDRLPSGHPYKNVAP